MLRDSFVRVPGQQNDSIHRLTVNSAATYARIVNCRSKPGYHPSN